MCGIFGYKGVKNNAGHIVIEGLRRLDYRGYDSWGIGFVSKNSLIIKKEVGKIGDISNSQYLPNSHTAIAHTRWATTGAVTRINAHPHISTNKTFLLAQNGIVENYQELKAGLEKKAYSFISETDTEVIVRLIEDALKTQKNYIKAIRFIYSKLIGRNTIILLRKNGEIYAARNGSPLVIGINTKTKEIFLSSDTLSFSPYVNKMIVVENNQIVRICNKNKIKIFNMKNGKISQYKLEDMTIKVSQVNKAGYRHYMIKEINETPQAIKQIINQDKNKIIELSSALKSADHVYIIGSGTAGFASAQIAFYLRLFGNINVISLVGADARSYYDIFNHNDLIIAPSQSGETADVIEVLEFAKKKGVKIASIVNMPGSMMTRMSDYPFMSSAGPEICVMSTKIFTSQIAWGYLVAKTVQGRYKKGVKNLEKLTIAIRTYLINKNNHKIIKNIAKTLIRKSHIFLLGKYQNLSIINEGMVKIIEATYKHAHALPAGDLKHYAITLMEKGILVIIVISDDIVKNDLITAINEIRLRGAEIIAIAHKNQSIFDYYIPTKDTKETDAISNIIPLQLLAYYMAIKLGNNIDKPRNIAKSVTVK